MNVDFADFFPVSVKATLANDPPGAWIPHIPDGCIRLSAGYPAPSLVPTDEIPVAVKRMIEEEGHLPFQYLGSPRMQKLRSQVRQRLLERGMAVGEDELLITAGGCQAIDLIARSLLDSESAVVVEGPTYMEALEIFRNYTQNILSVPMDEHGLQTDALERMLRDRRRSGLPSPKFLYTIPSFHNPTGTTMPLTRRRRLLELAEEFNFLVVEDDAYGELCFAECPVPLKALDTTSKVIHVGSLSKVVAPGMRVGWIAGPKPLVSAAAWFKKDLDHPFAEAAMAAYLETINLEDRLSWLRDSYRQRRDSMVQALQQFMPRHVTWHVPQGGFFVWLRVIGADTASLLEQAIRAGVAYVPGKYFFVNPADGLEYLRLSFSYVDLEDMREGVRRLGELLSASQP
jgi:2-aminoadipate transaminase